MLAPRKKQGAGPCSCASPAGMVARMNASNSSVPLFPKLRACVMGFALVGTACDKDTPVTQEPAAAPTEAAAPATTTGDSTTASSSAEAEHWASILAGAHRSPESRARDQYRHPVETLSFFGIKPDSSVIELAPGEGWYTEILGPYLKDSGKLFVTIRDPNGPPEFYGTGQAQKYQARLTEQAAVFGSVQFVIEPAQVNIVKGKVESVKALPLVLGPEASVDMVLTFRSSHGWYNRESLDMVYGAAFKVLKPGGVFGIEQHRAAQGADPTESAKKGYLPEATIIEAAERVGFKLAGSSEINANPKDTKDYADGVWTLPPTLRLGDTDRAKYEAIGESDRMTLKFVKPAH